MIERTRRVEHRMPPASRILPQVAMKPVEAAAANDVERARAIPLPRATDVVGMRDHHLENCTKLGL